MKTPKEVREDYLKDANKLLALENKESSGKLHQIKVHLQGLKHSGKDVILIADLEKML